MTGRDLGVLLTLVFGGLGVALLAIFMPTVGELASAITRACSSQRRKGRGA